jgi:hypothetical protein
METGTGQNQAKNAPGMLHIPLPTITHVFQNYAKRSQTKQEKHYLFALAESVGTAIAQQTRGGPGQQDGGFSIEAWLTECGIDPQWGQLAA